MHSSFFSTDYISVKGIRTRYATAGDGETILFLHGFPETLQTWRYYPKYLSQQFRLVVFDLKGFGYSDKPDGDYSPYGMAEFVKDFMDTMQIDNVYLVGTDTGLTIACAFGLRYSERVKKLILMAGTVYREGIVAPEVKLLSIKPLGELIFGLCGPIAIKLGLRKGFYDKSLITEHIFNEYYKPFREPIAKKRALELFRSFDKAVSALSLELRRITTLTLIMWAQHERFFSFEVAERLHKDIKNSRLEIIPDCGHFIQEEKPQESARLILSFIREK